MRRSLRVGLILRAILALAVTQFSFSAFASAEDSCANLVSKILNPVQLIEYFENPMVDEFVPLAKDHFMLFSESPRTLENNLLIRRLAELGEEGLVASPEMIYKAMLDRHIYIKPLDLIVDTKDFDNTKALSETLYTYMKHLKVGGRALISSRILYTNVMIDGVEVPLRKWLQEYVSGISVRFAGMYSMGVEITKESQEVIIPALKNVSYEPWMGYPKPGHYPPKRVFEQVEGELNTFFQF